MPPDITSAPLGKPQPDAHWDEHYRDERDAAFLYRALAQRREGCASGASCSSGWRVVEDRHVARWEELFREAGRPLPAYKTAMRTRALAWVATTIRQRRSSCR